MRNLTYLLLFLPALASGQLALKDRLPPWARERWTAVSVELSLDLSGRINPFVQRGDFDGDGEADLALLVQQNANRKAGILILQRNGRQSLLGTARAFGNGGDDFEWMDFWSVEDQADVKKSGQGRAIKLHRDSLLVGKQESASAIIYWKDGSFHWRQRGD